MRETGETPVQSRCCKSHCHRPISATARKAHFPDGKAARVETSQKTCRMHGPSMALPRSPEEEKRNPYYLSFMKKLLHMALCWSGLGITAAYGAGITRHTGPADTLGTVEIVATRPVAGIAATAPLQRLDSADLRLRGITDTGDALRRFAGVNLRDYGGAGGLKTVSVRGLGASHTAVAYDGLCVNDTRQGQIDLQRFSVDRLAGLELHTLDGGRLLAPVRNLAAVLIDLHTLRPDTLTGRFKGTAAVKQGSFGTWNASLNGQQSIGRRTFAGASTDWFAARNDYPFTVENGVATTRLRRTNSRMQTANAEANVLHRLKHGNLEGKIYFYHNYRRLPGQVILYVNENNERLTEQNAFGQARWTHRKGRMELFAAAKYNWQRSMYTDIDAQYPGGALKQHYRQQEYYATAGISFDFAPWLSAAYATDYAHAAMKSNLKADNDVSRNTWLQSLSLQLHKGRWNLLLRGVGHYFRDRKNGRADTQATQRVTPSASVSFRLLQAPLRLYLRGGYKESFRMPTFTEAYFYHLGSAELRPEHTRQLNAGLTLQASPARFWPLLSLTADAYYNKVSDRIVSVPYNLFIWRTVNMGEVRSSGCDWVLESRWKPARKHLLALAANYSYQSAKDRTSPGSDTYGNQLAYTPRHFGAASLAWENPWLSVVAHTTFAARRWSTNEHLQSTLMPAYNEWGFAVYRTFSPGKVRIEARADLMNAFSERYEVIKRYPMPERSYSLSCKIHF